MLKDRFLLIQAAGSGFWWDMHHVLGQLLVAELTQRIPVVYWGKNSMYSTSVEINNFEQFFSPVSDYTVLNLINEDFTYYPPIWNSGNLLCSDSVKSKGAYLDLNSIMSCNANVLIHDFYVDIEEIAQWIKEGHPLYGLSTRDLYSHMLKKYIRLQPDIMEEINSFYRLNMIKRPVIAVHIRGSDKILEVSHLHQLNERYPAEIDKYLKMNPSASIFIMTDCNDILSKYKKLYGDIVIHTDCKRVSANSDFGVHFRDYSDKKRKGFEIILDTWLAAKCDYFIGNGHSNVSRGISELKDWQDKYISLIY